MFSIGSTAPEAATLPGVDVWRHVTLRSAARRSPGGYPLVAGAAADEVRPELERALGEFRPSAIVFANVWIDGSQSAVRRCGARTIFDSHNVYAAYAAGIGDDVAAARALECATLREVDEAWVCSADDARALRAACGARTAVRVIPNGIDVAYYADIRAGKTRRMARRAPALLFVGSFWYEPNRLAAETLVADILPRVRAELGGDVRLLLVGAAPSEAMLSAANLDRGIVVTGRVADVRPYLTLADVVVVPLAHGSGTRLKLLEAFAAARPVVATAKAAEGLEVGDGVELLMRETPADIAAAVCELLREPDGAAALAATALRTVTERYSWEALRATVRAAVAGAVSRDFR
ncbi:MAG: glycosyltransferase family 4 protein [Candidatus Velthaea sp.]